MIPVKVAAKAGAAVYQAKKHRDKKAEKEKQKAQEEAKMKDYREAEKAKQQQDKQKQDKQKTSKAAIRSAEMARNNPYRRFQNEHDAQKGPIEKRKSSFEMTMQEEVNAMQADADKKGMRNPAQKVQENALDK